jgi:elongation factor 2
MARKEVVVEKVAKLMGNLSNIRNMGIVAHVDHGKTTLSDTLVARAGLISQELAGEQRVLDYDEQEQARGITIKAANISIAFNYQGSDYLINLIDTPGHVDFGGHVTRAMRAVDGIILVVDCVEGIMPQTETNLRAALKERVRPVLFINKIDRYINELKLSRERMQERFLKIIMSVNKLIEQYAPPEFAKEWQVDVMKGSVAFGTAFNKWAISGPTMKRKNLNFQNMYDMCIGGEHAKLQEIAPLDDVILEMVVNNLPSPLVAQKYRIPTIWHGDTNSEIGKAMVSCDQKGRAVFMVTAIQMDPHAGEVAIGRLFSGRITKGTELFLASKYASEKVQQVAVYMGPDRVIVEDATAGNIVALVGLHEVYAGETVSEGEIEPFEKIKHYSVPVITKSIEAKDPRDLVKLIEVLRKLSKEDPTLKVEINQQTGEHLISGMGELHLEIIEYKITHERGVQIVTSPPIVLYKETISARGPELEGKSPNKHNKFKLYVEPLEESVVKAFDEGAINDKAKGKELVEQLIKAGLAREEAKGVMAIEEDNLFIDSTKGVQYLLDIKELLIQGFREAVRQGPQAREEVTKAKVVLTDATIHVDPAHRGPAQILPALKRPTYAGMLMAKPLLLEPKQKLVVLVPGEYLSNVITLVNGRRGQVIEITQEAEATNIIGKVPVAEMFGFSNDIRSATQGRASWYFEYAGYERLPAELQARMIGQIRKRKGEPEVPPTAREFLEG